MSEQRAQSEMNSFVKYSLRVAFFNYLWYSFDVVLYTNQRTGRCFE